VLIECGELESAEPLFASAVRGGAVNALAGWIALRERRGDVNGACELLSRVQDLARAPLEVRVAAARVLRRVGRAVEAVALLTALVAEPLSAAQRVAAHHALGDALEDAGRFDDAFAAWKTANDARGIRFDADAWRARLASERGAFTRERFEALPRARERDDRPVLVVGAPRSGTSLVEQMLAAHPRIAGAGELDDLPRLTAGLDPTNVAELDRVAASYSARLSSIGGAAQRVTDKLPHNALHLGRIALCCPGARVVYVRRNPLDVGLSIYSRNFHATHDYATDLASIGVFLTEYEQMMEHWKLHAPLPILELRYEELVASPEPQARALVEFLGLDWDPAVLRFHELKRDVRTASYAQVRQPLYSRSIGRAALFDAHLEPLRAALASARAS